jgi:acetyl-CoA carboxylase biotin carboxyl carrier protein
MTTVTSDMAATVWQVNVEVGATVAQHDELLVLESMKMEIPVVAPVGGTVTAIHVAPADRVGQGDLLVEIG